MDWSHLPDHYVQLFSDSLYWIVLIFWLAIPYAGVAFLVYASWKWGQSMRPEARMEKELQAMIRQETHNGK